MDYEFSGALIELHARSKEVTSAIDVIDLVKDKFVGSAKVDKTCEGCKCEH
jgi:DNA-binding protein